MSFFEFEGKVPATELWFTEKDYNGTAFQVRVTDTLFVGQSNFQRIEIFQTEGLGKALVMDGCMMLTEHDEFVYHEMISHLPMLAHPDPQTVLVIGGGDGGTVRELVKHPTLKKVTMVEIDGLVVEKCREYFPEVSCALNHPKLDLRIEDGIKYVKDRERSGDTYDLVIVDSTDPFGPAAVLFTKEFYTSCRTILSDKGILVCQSESPFFYPKAIQKIYGLLGQVFPCPKMYMAHIPVYPSGAWSFAFCTKDGRDAQADFDPKRIEMANLNTKYYNAGLQSAAFVLPNFIRENLDSILKEVNV